MQHWPLEILTEAMSAPAMGTFAKYNLSKQELHALCHMHNRLNEVQIHLEVQPDGKLSMKMQKRE